MDNSEKTLDVAEPTMETEVEGTTESPEQEIETNQEQEFEFTDTEEPKTEEPVKETKTQPQSKEDNSKFAQARRKAEAESKKKEEEAFKRGKLEAYKGKINPYTNTEITDENDLEVYEEMCVMAKKGLDPVTDYASYIADKRREEKRQKEEKEKINEEAVKDIEEFQAKYPDVDLNDLLNDEDFKDYIDGKRQPLVGLYEKYKKLENKFRTNGIDVAKQTIANSNATPGSLNGGGEQSVDYANMSDAEFDRLVYNVKNGLSR